jgi:hypothetical protein
MADGYEPYMATYQVAKAQAYAAIATAEAATRQAAALERMADMFGLWLNLEAMPDTPRPPQPFTWQRTMDNVTDEPSPLDNF